jgi:hypothetical protein
VGDSSQLLSLVAVLFDDAAEFTKTGRVPLEHGEGSIHERVVRLGNLRRFCHGLYLGTFLLNWRGVAATAEIEQPTHDEIF